MTRVPSFRDLTVYHEAFASATEIYQLTKRFPKEELYSLTSQIRQSLRSVCANVAGAYRKRRYEAHFISKTSDADIENSETQAWLAFALVSQYIGKETYRELTAKSEEIGRMLNHMIENPNRYRRKGS